MQIRGLFHIHTTYSWDGKVTLDKLASLCRKERYKFIVITEHAESINDKVMENFIQKCESLSTGDVIIIPGLEFICNEIHIIALGIRGHFSQHKDVEDLINAIHNNGGIAILAHVSYYKEIPYEKLKNIDGIEVWNVRYDGRYAPSIKALRVLRKFKSLNNRIVAYGGLDLHNEHEFGKLSIVMEINDNKQIDYDTILNLLKTGNFKVTNNLIVINFNNISALSLMPIVILRLIHTPLHLTKKIVVKIFKIIQQISNLR